MEKKNVLLEKHKHDLSTFVFYNKYALTDKDNNVLEMSKKDMNHRLAGGMAKCERDSFKNDYSKWYEIFKEQFDNNLITFAGRVLYALNNPYDTKSTLSNCFVLDIEKDSIDGISATNKDMMNIMKMGGGVGFDISKLRPKGAPVNNSAKISTGAVSFMDLFSTATGIIAQNGRRGALILTISINHPDVMDFIKIKHGDKTKIENANISIQMTDKFMGLVYNNEMDAEWETAFKLENGDVFKKNFRVGDIWEAFIDNNHSDAEPACLFNDAILKNDPANQIEHFKYVTTNPCFAGDTSIAVADGRGGVDIRVLSEENKEFPVYSAKHNGKEWVCEVKNAIAFKTGHKKVIKLYLSNGFDFVCTPEHLIANLDGTYTEAKNTLGMAIHDNFNPYNYQEYTVKVIKIEDLNESIDVYDLTVEDNHNFYINNDVSDSTCLVHNCGEIPMSANESCNLGSIVLHNFVINPFRKNAVIDYDKLSKSVELLIRGLDNIVEINQDKQPLLANKIKLLDGRRIGLGITGLADMLAFLGIKYDSDEAIKVVDDLMSFIKNQTIKTSIDLAIERGSFPYMVKHSENQEIKNFKNHDYFKTLSSEYQKKLQIHGIRNVSLTTVAPNGSISLTHDNCSAGIEPVYSIQQVRKVKSGDETLEMITQHHTLKRYEEIEGEKCSKEIFVEAENIDYEYRIKMQATIQKHITSSISSTVNLPESVDKSVISDIYKSAWKNGLKGITVYRDGCRGNVLSSVKENQTETKYKLDSPVLQDVKSMNPDVNNVIRKIIKSEYRKWYVFITPDSETNLPYDIFTFTNSTETRLLTNNVETELLKLAYLHLKPELVKELEGKSHKQSNIQKMSRIISMLLRHRIPIIEIINSIENVEPPIYSFLFQVKKLLKTYLEGSIVKGVTCDECGENMVFEGGCEICKSCGNSKC